MAGFSIDAALKSGFRLARREWKAVLVWGFGSSVLGLVMQAMVIGPAMPAYLREMARNPEAASQAIEQNPIGYTIMALALMLIAALAGVAAFYGAVARAMLRPEERAFFFVRLGRRELWLMLTSMALALLAMVVGLTVWTAVTAAVVGLGAATGSPVVLWGLLLGAPALVGWLYLGARFSMAWVQAWDEQRFVLLDSWRLTRGQGWRIVLMLLALIFLMLIITVVVMIPVFIVAGIFAGVAGLAGGGGAMATMVLLGAFGLVFFSLFYGVLYTAMSAPYVEVYRSLKAA